MPSKPVRLSLLALAVGLTLSGCGNLSTRTGDAQDKNSGKRDTAVVPPYTGGGYYKGDGPGANPPANLDAIPDAQPRREAPHPFANRIYKVKGQRYVPDVSGQAYKARGLASWYGRKFHGRPTSSGEPYDMYAMTAAHRTLPIPSYARVTNVESGDSVVVRINDRGPFHDNRLIDLSYTAAHKLGVLKEVSLVEVERLLPEQDSPNEPEGTEPPPTLSASLSNSPSNPPPQTDTGPVQAVYLQVGAFGNPVAADDLTGRLIQKLGRTIPGVLRLEEGPLFKVQVGPFTSMAAADAAMDLVAAAVDVKPFKFSAPPSMPDTPAMTTDSLAAAPVPDAPALLAASATPPDKPVQAYWLQLAAFSRDGAADELIRRIQSQAIVPGVEKRQDQGLSKVQAGPYASASQADEDARRLAELLGQRPFRLVR